MRLLVWQVVFQALTMWRLSGATCGMGWSRSLSLLMRNCWRVAFLARRWMSRITSKRVRNYLASTCSTPLSLVIPRERLLKRTRNTGSSWKWRGRRWKTRAMTLHVAAFPSEPKPMDFLPVRFWMILSIPSKAPPQINNMLVVSS